MERNQGFPVGVVVVSHSRALADELIKFASQMKTENFPLLNAAGTGDNDNGFGTNALYISEKIVQADKGGGVLVLADIGSGVMSAVAAIEMLDGHTAKLADAPLLEGLVAVVASNVLGVNLDALLAVAEQTRGVKKL